MTYKVTFSSGNNYNVKLSNPSKYKISSKYTFEIMPQYLRELQDVQITDSPDKYILMYDAVSGMWKNVNPDDVLSASASLETSQPGLPTDFINTLDVELDNKIDLDAGIF